MLRHVSAPLNAGRGACMWLGADAGLLARNLPGNSAHHRFSSWGCMCGQSSSSRILHATAGSSQQIVHHALILRACP